MTIPQQPNNQYPTTLWPLVTTALPLASPLAFIVVNNLNKGTFIPFLTVAVAQFVEGLAYFKTVIIIIIPLL